MGKKVYVAIWEDRHCDPTAHVFTSAERATEWARAKVREFDRFGDLDETPVQGWLYNGVYSCDGDGIHVVEVEVDKEVSSGDEEAEAHRQVP